MPDRHNDTSVSAPATSNTPPSPATSPDDLLSPFRPEHRRDPFPAYRRLQRESPVHRTPFGWWLVSRYDDCWSVLRDRSFASQPNRMAKVASDGTPIVGGHPVFREGTKVLLFLDPPDHTRLRSLVNRAFTPRTVQRLRPRIDAMVDELVGRALARGEGALEIMGDLAYPLPAWVICELLGVPAADRDRFKDWSSAATRLLDGGLDDDTLNQALAGTYELSAYFVELFAHRRTDLGDDLISRLLTAEEEGDHLDPEELLTTTVLLFIAGHETTMNLIGNGLLALLRHRDQWHRLVEQPDLAPSAVEELLRFAGPVQLVPRIATETVTLAGVTIEPGEPLSVLLAAANRDPDRFPDPDRLDIAREDNAHLAFAAGVHHCLGAPLARLEAEIVFGALARRFPDLSLAVDPDRIPLRDHVILRGLLELRVDTGTSSPSVAIV